MQLEQWLQINKMTPKIFAVRTGKSPGLIHRYLYEDVIPQIDSMRVIYQATHGTVTANDFYKLTPDLLFRETRIEFD